MQIDAMEERMKVSSDFECRIVTKPSEPFDRIVKQSGAIGTKDTGDEIGFARHEPIDGGFEIAILQEEAISNMPNQLMGERRYFRSRR